VKVLSGGLSNIDGFSSLGKSIGIKAEGKDLGILFSEKVCSAAAVYTKNSVKGAPLYITKEHLADAKAQAIVVNSRVANVARGALGNINAKKTTELVARELGINQSDVLVASTGVIGPQLPMDKIEAGIKGIKAELKPDGDFAEAILTTDTHKKEICVDYGSFKIAAAAKGSGMIAPNMATLLVFIATDALVAPDKLEQALKASVDKTLNMTSIDTDTSTSDMAIIMANGKAQDADYQEFCKALDYVCLEITKMIVMDGEGVTKLITCEIQGAASEEDAKKAAKAVIDSPLVKTAVYGNDPNWGRLMMAIGKSGADIHEEKVSILVNSESIAEGGKASDTYDGEKLTQLFKDNEEINFVINLGTGEASATAYGCDLSEEYIRINAEYTT
jgi:glutamate N-acetyltransferase/amino-acid N-acetyltransferase